MARLARQPALGLAGVLLVVPVAVLLGAGLGSLERSLLVLGPYSTFALPVIAMVAFWWEDRPGTTLRAPLLGLSDTLLVAACGVVLTIAAQALVSHAFPATMALGGAIFTVMLQLTLVAEGAPLRRLARVPGGLAALAVAWVGGIAIYEATVPTGLLGAGELGSALVCVGEVQVVVYVVLQGRPFAVIGRPAVRRAVANVVVVACGCLADVGLAVGVGLAPLTIAAAAGSVVAGGLVVGMLFEGWLDSAALSLVAVGAVSAVLYIGLQRVADSAGWTRAEPEAWTAYAALNAIGAGVILHVGIGRRWPFSRPARPAPARTPVRRAPRARA